MLAVSFIQNFFAIFGITRQMIFLASFLVLPFCNWSSVIWSNASKILKKELVNVAIDTTRASHLVAESDFYAFISNAIFENSSSSWVRKERAEQLYSGK